MHEFEPGPLTQNFLDNMTVTWPQRIIKRNIDYNGDPSTDNQYTAWVQMQQTEKDDFIISRRTRSLQASSAQGIQKKRRQN